MEPLSARGYQYRSFLCSGKMMSLTPLAQWPRSWVFSRPEVVMLLQYLLTIHVNNFRFTKKKLYKPTFTEYTFTVRLRGITCDLSVLLP